MGFPKADREEEGAAFLQLGQPTQRLGGDASVVVGLVGHVIGLAHADGAVFAKSFAVFGVIFGEGAVDHRRVVAVVGVVEKLGR